MIDKNKLSAIINKEFSRVVTIRRTIHENPELSGEERKTAAFVGKELENIGIKPIFYLDKTAVVGRIKNGSGKTVVLRADLDALPIEEATGLPFISKTRGVMHACGHDLHTAILLGAARVLYVLKSEWSGTVVFLFQPSEEKEPGGAARLIKIGAFPKKCDAVFGLHVNPDHETGTIGLRSGVDFAGVMGLSVVVTGKGGHSAAPDKAINPIPALAAMIGSLQKLNTSQTLVTVGTVAAGTRQNIIPGIAELSGTIRTHNRTQQKSIKSRISSTLAEIAKSFKCTVTVTLEDSYPPSFNDSALTNRMGTIYGHMIGPQKVIHRPHPTMYAEDFACYEEKAPGLFIHLGVRPKKLKTMPNIHSPLFSPDEAAMKTGILAHVVFSLEMLS